MVYSVVVMVYRCGYGVCTQVVMVHRVGVWCIV